MEQGHSSEALKNIERPGISYESKRDRSSPCVGRRTIMRILTSLCISVAITLHCGTASAVEPTPETQIPKHSLTWEHTREEESASIRKHHLKRLDDRLPIFSGANV